MGHGAVRYGSVRYGMVMQLWKGETGEVGHGAVMCGEADKVR